MYEYEESRSIRSCQSGESERPAAGTGTGGTANRNITCTLLGKPCSSWLSVHVPLSYGLSLGCGSSSEMTILIPLDPSEHSPIAGPSRSRTARSTVSAAFASPSPVHVADLERLLDAVREAKRIVVITGAGISTAAAIPDFRSATGLFGPPRARNKGKGREKEPSVKDLFHVAALKVSVPAAGGPEVSSDQIEPTAASPASRADCSPCDRFLVS